MRRHKVFSIQGFGSKLVIAEETVFIAQFRRAQSQLLEINPISASEINSLSDRCRGEGVVEGGL